MAHSCRYDTICARSAVELRVIARYLFIIIAICISSNTFAQTGQSSSPIVISLRPVQLITQEIVGEHVAQHLLPLSSEHAHSYSIKFSQLQLLQSSRLLIWLGPEFEHYLEKPLAAMSPKVRDFSLLQRGEQLHRQSSSGDQTHVWLDPLYIRSLIPVFSETLANEFPEHRPALIQSGEAFIESLHDLHERTTELLRPYKGMGVISDHGGLEVFLHRYGLRHTGSLQTANHGSLSLQRARSLREEIRLGNATCVAVSQQQEHESHSGLASLRLFDGQEINVAELDWFGDDARSYEMLISELAARLASCLASGEQ
ncbi:MAG: metal ABC transporter solute-binding protein, Zn/Mn family [Pseudomonadales bacterium]